MIDADLHILNNDHVSTRAVTLGAATVNVAVDEYSDRRKYSDDRQRNSRYESPLVKPVDEPVGDSTLELHFSISLAICLNLHSLECVP